MKFPRFVIAAPKSGSGKTLITTALMQAFKERGLKISGFKCGPDYIDPMFHQKVLEIPSRNLDLFFTDEKETQALFTRSNNADLSIIEGVMGLYDGLDGIREEGSTYHLASTLQCPVILVIDARGMGRSLLAEIQGFADMDRHKIIKGLILNNIPKSFYEKISPLVSEGCKIPLLGFFPNQKDLQIESRHLGLKLPDEISGIREMVKRAGEKIERCVNLDQLLKIAEEACELEKNDEQVSHKTEKVRIGLARDEAFCFYYDDNLKLLEKAGAEIIEFSPIHDKKLPENICGLIFGGGYPEFYAKDLAENQSVMEEIRLKIAEGLPSLAECGGFMYLHKNMTCHDKSLYQMAAVIDGDCYYTGKLVRFGYATVKPGASDKKNPEVSDWFGKKGFIKGHEFHYFDSSKNGQDCLAEKNSGLEYKCGLVDENHFWSFLHLYYPSNPEFAEIFVEKCRIFQKKGIK